MAPIDPNYTILLQNYVEGVYYRYICVEYVWAFEYQQVVYIIYIEQMVYNLTGEVYIADIACAVHIILTAYNSLI